MSSIGTVDANDPDNPFTSPNGRPPAGPGQPPDEAPSPFAQPQYTPAQPRFATPEQPKNGQVNGAKQPPQPRQQAGGPQPRNGAARPGGSRGQSIAQLAQSIGDMELSNQDDLHAFMEAYRTIQNYLAITAKLAEGQLKTAARAQARNSKDGWMNPAQRAQLAITLKLVGRDIDRMANDCVSAATCAVKAWRRFEGFLGDLEASGSGRHRPGGGRSGFTVV